MKVFLKRRDGITAEGEYDPKTKQLTVFKGSMIHEEISSSPSFRGTKAIEKLRAGSVKNGRLTRDVVCLSASTAANLITGSSTNGFRLWRTEKGVLLKDLDKKQPKR